MRLASFKGLTSLQGAVGGGLQESKRNLFGGWCLAGPLEVFAFGLCLHPQQSASEDTCPPPSPPRRSGDLNPTPKRTPPLIIKVVIIVTNILCVPTIIVLDGSLFIFPTIL